MKRLILAATLLGACAPASQELSCDNNPLCTETEFDINPMVDRRLTSVHDACVDTLDGPCYIDFDKKVCEDFPRCEEILCIEMPFESI